MDLMPVLGLNELFNQMAMASGMSWYGHALMREDGHVFKKILVYEVGCRKRKETDDGWQSKQRARFTETV